MSDTVVPVALDIACLHGLISNYLHAHTMSRPQEQQAIVNYFIAHDAALQSRIAELEKDATRLDWMLPILAYGYDSIGDERTNALVMAMAEGCTGREQIDAAIEASK